MLPNQMKHKLTSGNPAFGVSVMFPSPHIVDIIGRLGFDWVLIDCEHGSISLESVELMVMAAESAGITPIARPPSTHSRLSASSWTEASWECKCPMSHREDARKAVEAVKYHPLGERGLAAGVRAANYGYGMSMSDYAEQSNAETLVCVQLEEGEAVSNVDEIVQVDGVDVFFVGPSDLSQSLGYPGRPDAPPVREAMDTVFATIAAAGKLSGSAGNAAAHHRYMQQGVTYLYTHLTTLLSSAASTFLDDVTS